jgi:gas vesicle protein
MGISKANNYTMKMNDNTKLLLGVLAGAAAGYLLGTLLAPKKGSDTRQGLLDSFNDLSDSVSDLITEGKDKLSLLSHLGGEEPAENGVPAGKAGKTQNW